MEPFVDGSGRCSSIKQQASIRHQAASIKHQAASIKKLGSETLARNSEILFSRFSVSYQKIYEGGIEGKNKVFPIDVVPRENQRKTDWQIVGIC